ncbi:MAG: 4-hydroxy-tetrahydrodipicolinate reductase [Salinarimonadaceae bacterium]|nr:MAG: 4-hydroxy-tetrahydrodipicolinate reductase [Salinarimonadaceae bacterium]
MAKTRIAVVGAAGRMGRMLIKTIDETPGCALTAALERPTSGCVGQDAGLVAGVGDLGVLVTCDAKSAIAEADVLVDFTTPEASLAYAAIAAEAQTAHVIGTTGFSDADFEALKVFGEQTVIVQSGNMSLGVNILAAIVRKVAGILGEDFDIEIVEMHHRQKVDAPSGTALLLGQAAAEGRGIDLGARSARARDGITGARTAGDIGFAALRGGTVVGDHSVIFAGADERIAFQHIAEQRVLFARGAVKAAIWAKGQPAGYYSMADVLGLADL